MRMRSLQTPPGARGALWLSVGALISWLVCWLPGAGAESGADGIGQRASLPDYWSESRFLVDVPGASHSLAAGLFNPAAWPMRPMGGLYFAWEQPVEAEGADLDRSNWLGVASLRALSFGVRSYRFEDAAENRWHWEEYTLGIGGGSRSGAVGLSYSWSDGPWCAATRSERWNLGMIRRWRPAAVGLTGLWERTSTRGDGTHDYAVQADLAVRPLGPRVTLFADAVWQKDQDFAEIRTGYGLEVHPVRGLALGAKALNTGEISFRVSIGLAPSSHPSVGAHLDRDGEYDATTYAVEGNSPLPDIGLFAREDRFPEIELKGPTVYRRYRYFDDRRTLLGLLQRIDRLATDPRAGGVVLNLSGARIGSEMLWELRQQLAGLRAAGKRVVIYGDEMRLSQYLLASVADQIWIDPEGMLEIPGIAAGRTYLRGTLEKLGIGFEEWRFFTYKSAFEMFSHDRLSEADREQIGLVIDDFYEEVSELITAGRGLSRAQWDRVVNEKAMLNPREAQEAGLVDSIGTYEQAKKAARRAASRGTADVAASLLGDLTGDPVWGPMQWGEPPRIALLYAIGPCEMDEGIRGRLLSKKLKEAREDTRVKAVVLRADSPGGSALASDLVAREMQETAKVKPMIVSQGAVAGSGGYWISMYADTIVASPLTVTGSIGVIGGWFWDNGIGEKLGVTWDGVWRGDHADVGQGMQLPLFGMRIPERNLTPEERARVEYLIRDAYDGFLGKVAEGRGMTKTEVDRIGQGRIWSGTRGKEIGIVDEIGGLWRSLRLAKQAAGIRASRPVLITQGPSVGSFDLSFLRPRLLGLLGFGDRTGADDRAAARDPWAAGGYAWAHGSSASPFSEGEHAYLEALLRARGRPVHMMEPIQLSLEKP